jgi:ATP-binding cassette subfamily B protein RaxB
MQTSTIHFGRRRLQLMLQSEVAECGLACLAMIATYHGFRTDLATLRGRFSVSLNGATFQTLIGYADRIKLSGRPLSLELDELRDLKTPCILHWGLNHFVVLQRATAKEVVIYDPALGVRHMRYPEVSREFTGMALELDTMADFCAASEQRKVSIGALIGRVDGWWQGIGIVFLMCVALEALGLAAPMFNQAMVDEVLVSGDRSLRDVLALGLLLLVVVQSALSQARGWTIMYLSTHLNLQWVGNVVTHLLRLPMHWFEKRQLGDVLSRFGSLGPIQQLLTTRAIGAVLDGIMAVATFAMMMLYSPLMGMIVVATVALYALVRAVSYRPLREASLEAIALGAREQSYFLESIRAIQAIKLFGRELDRRARWMNLRVESINRGVRTQVLGLWFGNINQLIGALSGALVLWLGAGMVMDGAFTVGMLFALTAYSGQFGARMSSLINVVVDYKMLSMHAERLADIVLEPAEPQAVEGGRDIARLEPRIELVDVGFRYSDADPFVLRHVNLVIEPGESVAIAGPSGGGKTTLIKLIVGILVPTEGEIRYGGVALAQLGAHAYRAMLACVMQNDCLVSGSMLDNIGFADDKPDPARVIECAQLAMVHADIDAMPMRYETLIAEMGTTLSGGQQQRVLLARALYARPKVLVMDEATSSLDVALERAVNASIAALNITRIIVAHRPETIASARRVIGLRGGAVAHDAVQIPA